MMLSNVAMGSLMMILTTIIHTVFMVIAFRQLAAYERHPLPKGFLHRQVMVGIGVLAMFGASVVEVSAYAIAYLAVGAISGFERALYFSAVTLTTLGYGDVVLDPSWRLLSSFEAINGIIMFGWTTAMVVALVQRVYFRSNGQG